MQAEAECVTLASFFFFLINKIPFNVLLKINLRQEAVWRRVCAKLQALEKLRFFLSLCERLWLPCDRTNVTIRDMCNFPLCWLCLYSEAVKCN